MEITWTSLCRWYEWVLRGESLWEDHSNARIDVDTDDLAIEIPSGDGIACTEVPLPALFELLRLHGYEVTKCADATISPSKS